MDSKYFYRDLNPLSSFEEAVKGSRHAQLPADWYVVVADVVGSTQAVESGRYKDVNTVGAATIMAFINVDRGIEIPFIFGGDGATLAIPPSMVDGARSAALGAKEMALHGFNLDLRVGIVPASDLYEKDLWLGVAKYRQSAKMDQASFSGFGWNWAEGLLKNPETRERYEVRPVEGVTAMADFTGFECRWEPVKARHGFKLALIAQCMAKNSDEHAEIYSKILSKVREIYGTLMEHHPLTVANLELAYDPKKLSGEARVYGAARRPIYRFYKILGLMAISAFGNFAFARKLKISGVDWGGYRQEVLENADFRKFDGALKMVVDSSAEQEVELRNFLDSLYKSGEIAFGTNRSTHAIMTCLVFTSGQDHAHFVDGSDGGYAIAAKELKSQIARFKQMGSVISPR